MQSAIAVRKLMKKYEEGATGTLALRGVAFRAAPASDLLRRNLLIYGLGGVVVPFIGIFLIDLVVRFIPGI